MSLYGMGKLGSALSCLDFVGIGSALSVKSFARLGSSLSISNASTTCRLHRAIAVGTSPQLGGHLHGTWTVDSQLQVSDLRVKTNVVDILDFFVLNSKANNSTTNTSHAPGEKILNGPKNDGKNENNLWSNENQERDSTSNTGATLLAKKPNDSKKDHMKTILNKLRPVAFQMKTFAKTNLNPETIPQQFENNQSTNYTNLEPQNIVSASSTHSNRTHFGFIAQELEKIVPSLVQDVGHADSGFENSNIFAKEKRKGVFLTDLIAVLTANLQIQAEESQELKIKVKKLEKQVEVLKLDSSIENKALRNEIDFLKKDAIETRFLMNKLEQRVLESCGENSNKLKNVNSIDNNIVDDGENTDSVGKTSNNINPEDGSTTPGTGHYHASSTSASTNTTSPVVIY